jgi:hypothetical protein
MTTLAEQASLFDVNIPDFKQLKICRKEIKMLKVWNKLYISNLGNEKERKRERGKEGSEVKQTLREIMIFCKLVLINIVFYNILKYTFLKYDTPPPPLQHCTVPIPYQSLLMTLPVLQ